jgi:hypothetical protein
MTTSKASDAVSVGSSTRQTTLSRLLYTAKGNPTRLANAAVGARAFRIDETNAVGRIAQIDRLMLTLAEGTSRRRLTKQWTPRALRRRPGHTPWERRGSPRGRADEF